MHLYGKQRKFDAHDDIMAMRKTWHYGDKTTR